MRAEVFWQSEEDYERGNIPQAYPITLSEQGILGLCNAFCDYIEDYPNYHFRLREANGKYLYMCVRLNG